MKQYAILPTADSVTGCNTVSINVFKKTGCMMPPMAAPEH